MALLVSVQQAALNALASYLADVLPDVSVEPRWPDPDKKLPSKAITLIPAGPRTLLYFGRPEILEKVEDISPTAALYRWIVAEAELPVQMDIWTTYPLDRDDIIARLDNLVNVGFTALSGINLLTQNPVEDFIALELGDGWEGSNANFFFDTVKFDDTAPQTIRHEYRATYKGMGAFNLTIVAESPKIARINIDLKLSQANTYSEYSVTADGETFTETI